MTKPAIGATGWGVTLNAHLDTLQPTATLEADVASKVGTAGALDTALSATYAKVVAVQATGDGTTDDAAAFTAAATTAAAAGAHVYVPAPASSYRLDSDPVFPDGVSVIGASPSWFSGTGKMPFHLFAEISEGIDPRIFETQVLGYSETEPGETNRKWAVVGWVNYNNDPDPTAAAATEADAVGVDGRGVVSVKNGRVWALVGLAHMTPGAKDGTGYGVSQAYAAELDVNNSTGDHANLDGTGSTPVILGLALVSGGQNRPGEALRVDATRKNDGVDNRWHTALRVRGDAVKEYAVHLDDGFNGVFARIPTGGTGVHWTHGGVLHFAEYQEGGDQRRKLWSMVAGKGYDFVTSTGGRSLSTHDDSVEAAQPFRRLKADVAATATINAATADIQVLTPGVAAINDIANGQTGQRLTLINASGGTITVNEGANMRMNGGTFALTNTSTIEFVYAEPTWFEVSRSDNT